MATLGTGYIKFDIEPIVKIICLATTCKHNGANAFPSGDEAAHCNLKHIIIDEMGCKMFVPVDKQDE